MASVPNLTLRLETVLTARSFRLVVDALKERVGLVRSAVTQLQESGRLKKVREEEREEREKKRKRGEREEMKRREWRE